MSRGVGRHNLGQRLGKVPSVVLDVETTGLNPKTGDRIIEIALLQVRGNQIISQLEQLINPQRSISARAAAVNGITAAMVRGQPLFSQVVPAIDRLLQGRIVVGHNIAFDLRFLAAEYALAQRPFPSLLALDTCKVAQHRFRFSKNKLEVIAQELGIQGTQYHRAMGDVQVTYGVFQHFQQRLQLETVGDWVQAQGGQIAPPRAAQIPRVTKTSTSIREHPSQNSLPDRSIPELVTLALQNHRKLEIYYAPPGKVVTQRTISVKSFDGTTISGYCFLKNMPRRFMLLHITQATLL